MELDDFRKTVESFRNHPIKTAIWVLVALVVLVITAYVTGFFGEKGRQDAISEKPILDSQSKPNTHIEQHTEGSQSPNIVSDGDVTIIYDQKKGSEGIIVHPKQVSFRRGCEGSQTYFTLANDTPKTQFNVEVQVILKNLMNLFEKISVKAKGPQDDESKLEVDDILSLPFDVQYLYNVPNESGENTIRIRIAKLAPTESMTFQINYECNNVQIMKDKGHLVLPLRVVNLAELGSTIVDRISLGKYQILVPVEKSTAEHMLDRETMEKYSKQNKCLKAAYEYAHVNDYLNAANMFEKAIELIPESRPKLAFNYGLCLYKDEAFEKALNIWELVPKSELHKYLDVYRGLASWVLGRRADAVTFMEKAIKDIEPTDAEHWRARAILVFARTASSGTDQFAQEAYRFCEEIDKAIRCFTEKAEKPSSSSSDQALGEVRKRQEAAFSVLMVLAEKFNRRHKFQESLETAYRAAEYLKGKSQLLFYIDEAAYLRFLETLVSALNNVKVKNRELFRLNTLLSQIEQYSISQGEQKIADMAMLIRGFYVDGETIRPVKKGVFRFTYVGKCNDDTGLKNLYAESSSYLLGNKRIGLKREKKYMFRESMSIGPDVALSEKPYFRIRVEDIDGNTSPWIDIFPFIVATQQGG